MANKIIIKRGAKANLPVLSLGEFGYCTDTKELYIGGTSGNVLVTGITPTLNITDTKDSTSSTTGALVVNGGVGVAKNLTVGGIINVANISGTNNGNDIPPDLNLSGYSTRIKANNGDISITAPAGIVLSTSNTITMNSANPISLNSGSYMIFMEGSQGTHFSARSAKADQGDMTVASYFPLVVWSDTNSSTYRSNTSISGNLIQARYRGNSTDYTSFTASTLYLNRLGGDIHLGDGESTKNNKILSYFNNFLIDTRQCIGIGNNALYNARNIKFAYGGHNIAIGQQALELLNSVSALYNIAIGSYAGLNVNGTYNTVMGFDAFKDIGTAKTASNNTVIGSFALTSPSGYTPSSSIQSCTVIGNYALNQYKGTSTTYRPNFDTAVGYNSMKNFTYTSSSGFNTSVGYQAGESGSGYGHTYIGYTAGRISGGYNNTYIGNSAGGSFSHSYHNCTCIGYNASHPEGDNQIRLGDSQANVYVGSGGSVVHSGSDERDKADIRLTVLGLDFIDRIEAIDYKWDCREDYVEVVRDEDGEFIEKIEHKKDGSRKRNRYHHGVSAQQIQSIIKETGIDFGGFQDHSVNGGGDVMTIGYEEFISPLIKAVQELHSIVMKQGKEIKSLQEERA